MPSATAKPAPTAKVSTKTITTAVTEPVEQNVAIAAPLPEPSQDFWKYIEALTADDWKEHHVTLYRYPLGQAKPQKLGRYVKTYKFGSPLLSEDQIFEEFGGSQYDALLKGPGRDGRVTLLAKHSWEMDGPAKNPWTTAPPNGGAPAGSSELAATLQVVLQNLKQASAAPNAAESPAIKESISLIQQLTQAMPKQQGVGELVSALADLKKLTGGGDGGGNSLIETIKVLKELGIIGEKKRSLAEELKDMLEVTAMLGTGGGGGKVDWGTSLIQNLPTILEKATPIAEQFADAARNNARVAELRSGHTPAAPPQTPANRPAPALVAPPTAPAAATAPAAESPASRIVTMPETEPATAQPAAQPAFQAPNLDWVKARAVQLFGAGKTGDVVAEWLDGVDDQLGNFLGSMDAEKFRAFVTADPILHAITSAPRFEEFVAEFVDYFSADAEQK